MSERPDPKSSKVRQSIFAVLPALLLLALAEVGTRLVLVAEPALRSLPLAPEQAGLFRADPELFWSLAVGLDRPFLGQRVVTNSLGLRSPEVVGKRDGEFRILSLGESSTFGSGVAGDQTYTAQLVRELEALGWSDGVTAINAGVPAYSSFQSLKYLEQRGFALEPDLVLFYHEVNDYLPSSLRDSSNSEIGVVKTDMQLHDSRVRRVQRLLSRFSAVYRFASLALARRRIEAFNTDDFFNPVTEIGLPDISIPPRLADNEPRAPVASGLHEGALGRRVSDEEREQILLRLKEIGGERGIALIVIHPAYRQTEPHVCLLTRVCEAAGISVFDAWDSLHLPEMPAEHLYRDSMHPNVTGHARLARDLAEFIIDSGVADGR